MDHQGEPEKALAEKIKKLELEKEEYRNEFVLSDEIFGPTFMIKGVYL